MKWASLTGTRGKRRFGLWGELSVTVVAWQWWREGWVPVAHVVRWTASASGRWCVQFVHTYHYRPERCRFGLWVEVFVLCVRRVCTIRVCCMYMCVRCAFTCGLCMYSMGVMFLRVQYVRTGFVYSVYVICM